MSNITFIKSDSIKHIAAALLQFQSSIGKLPRNASNPFFKSKYCPLSTIIETIQEPLAANGLCYAQFPDGDYYLTTILIHAESGEYMQASYNIHPKQTDPQSMGSAITYGRRYSLGALLGLNIDEDDDGNKASQGQKQNKGNTGTRQPQSNDDSEVFEQWKDAISQCKNQVELVSLYNANKQAIDGTPAIKALFTERKKNLNLQPA